MLVQTVVRGNIVEFEATFLDANDEVIEPASALLVVNFLTSEGTRENEEVTMVEQTDGSWFATWSSANAEPARVYWSMRSSDPESAQDGLFDLKANLANLSDEST